MPARKKGFSAYRFIYHFDSEVRCHEAKCSAPLPHRADAMLPQCCRIAAAIVAIASTVSAQAHSFFYIVMKWNSLMERWCKCFRFQFVLLHSIRPARPTCIGAHLSSNNTPTRLLKTNLRIFESFVFSAFVMVAEHAHHGVLLSSSRS